MGVIGSAISFRLFRPPWGKGNEENGKLRASVRIHNGNLIERLWSNKKTMNSIKGDRQSEAEKVGCRKRKKYCRTFNSATSLQLWISFSRKWERECGQVLGFFLTLRCPSIFTPVHLTWHIHILSFTPSGAAYIRLFPGPLSTRKPSGHF